MENQETVATIAELKAAIPDSNAAFRETCVEAGCSVAQAKDRWMDVLRAAIVSERERKVKPTVPGNPIIASPGASAGGSSGNARAEWDEAIKTYMDKGKSFDAAASAVNRERPGLREAMLQEHNAMHSGAWRAMARNG